MKHFMIIGAALFLAGCASEPMTPEQRAVALQYLTAQTSRPPPPQPQPYYVPIPQNRTVNCTSYPVGNTVNTTCN